MATRDPLRAAIIGYGLAGSVFHAPLISATPGMAVAAVVTGNPSRQEQVAAEVPDAAVLADSDEIWERAEDFDLVVVAAPNRVHARLAEASMRAGVPAVVDKPLATSVDDARRLASLSQETGVLLSVFHNRRWDNDFLTVRRLLDEGQLGQVLRFESRFERYRPQVAERWRESPAREDGGGLLYDLGSHLIDQALVLFGAPSHVYAEVERRRPGAEVDDDTFVALRFPSGPVAHLWMSAVVYRPAPRIRVSGMNGVYERYGLDPQEDALRSGRRPGEPGWGEEGEPQWGRLVAEVDGVAVDRAVQPEPGAYQDFYAGVRDALRGGGAPPVGAADGLAVLRVIEAARESAERATVVALEPEPPL